MITPREIQRARVVSDPAIHQRRAAPTKGTVKAAAISLSLALELLASESWSLSVTADDDKTGPESIRRCGQRVGDPAGDLLYGIHTGAPS